MKPSIKYIVNACLLLATLNAVAQDSLFVNQKDSTAYVAPKVTQDSLVSVIDTTASIEIDTTVTRIKQKYFAIYLSTDYGKLATTLAQLENKYEFNMGIQFSSHLRVTADYGYSKLSPPNAIENGVYFSTGNYYRVGLDYVFTIAPKTTLAFGGMYALATFKDEGTVEIQSEIWPSLSQSFERNDLQANWVEFVITSEAPILNRDNGFLSHLFWGIKFRFRFMIERPRPTNFDVYAIPGYGRTFNNLVPAANLFFSYKF